MSQKENDNATEPKPTSSVLYDPRVRAVVFQALLFSVLIWLGWTIFQNTLQNMESRGITTGFDFLTNPAGFEILMSLVEYDASHTYGKTFIVGLLNTVLVSLLGIFVATILGFVMGVARLSKNWLIAKIATVYVETLRNIPLLLQIFFWYFAVLQPLPSPRQSISAGEAFFLNNRGFYFPEPIAGEGFGAVWVALIIGIVGAIGVSRWASKRQEETGQPFPAFMTGLGLIIGLPLLAFVVMGAPLTWGIPEQTRFNLKGGVQVIPELIALLLALSTYTAAFIAEIVRAGILAVPHGQTEAAESLGVKRSVTLRKIIIPQAMRVVIPPLTSQYLNLAKNSSLATAIGYPDIVSVFMGTTLNQTGQAVEIVAMTMAVYLTISLVLSVMMNWYNKAMSLKER
ncbi:amino-acid transporter subunit; membrane component of ABC superfamily [Candidatus Terasakiella magnetica]|uniref:Amino-acid transporter subunit membrane component of ABC superfamily n=1 Tax=Candidatus Terasakiella magnetica TaxID=1867952 RepID=A0A1C3RJ35_9PROT|nr:amino acid ABC transporter permease [Candidatus Terasakiella magnetica]SCA57277.1 amino-acid transporter subunit; membrane component of ABC superfamily [Candidatus Terasakiella magnetica]